MKNRYDVYNCSTFFRGELNISKYNKDDVKKLKNLIPNQETEALKHIDDIVTTINSLKKDLSQKENLLQNYKTKRKNLFDSYHLYGNESTCPYCNQIYSTAEELDNAYSISTELLEQSKNPISEELEKKEEELVSNILKVKSVIFNNVGEINDEEYNNLTNKLRKANDFLNNEKDIKCLEKMAKILEDDRKWQRKEKNDQVSHIESLLKEKIIAYSNSEYETLSQQYNFEATYASFENILQGDQDNLINPFSVKTKINYLHQQFILFQDSEYKKLKKELKELLIKQKKLEEVRTKLDTVNKIYEEEKKQFKKRTMKNLRIPLLIYTGKILQDYQGGLGVFVDKEEMRFVANSEAKQDILNTFSSGQLSGFVLAFLFAMNKRYIGSTDLGFILIDDPVQTMDDINIASFIEVLRNDFKDKQIVISTHEIDKENYILYKFLKYNLEGQSFNVKEKLYPQMDIKFF